MKRRVLLTVLVLVMFAGVAITGTYAAFSNVTASSGNQFTAGSVLVSDGHAAATAISITGLRPGTPDNAPIIGADPAHPRVVWATGHFRNGILLCPWTADLVADILSGSAADTPFGPERFARTTGVAA